MRVRLQASRDQCRLQIDSDYYVNSVSPDEILLTTMATTKMKKVHTIFGIDIDAIPMEVAVGRLVEWLESPLVACRYVVTPNVDHIVKLKKLAPFRDAYKAASMVVADGKPLVLASRLLGRPLPETVPGSDLVPRLLEKASVMQRPVKVFLLGAAPGVADRAGSIIARRWPHVMVAGTHSPPFGFEHVPEECDRIVAQISACQPDLLIVGLGAPKQELWVHAHKERIEAKVVICAGATIDFIAGSKARAPVWMRQSGLEWLHRIVCEPRRLLGRYVHDALVFPTVLLREIFSSGINEKG
jgi:N-acetylglucosaminyldiphosphoundecaprenol N-acetyl-beta-D-mannosaminyltransferase